MNIVCLDLEGVLVPEIWLAVAERTGIPELRKTTRDIADYDELMALRLQTLERHSITLEQIKDCIAGMSPFPESKAFLEQLRQRFQLIILSDTFYDLAMPLMAQLGYPLLLCHRLLTDSTGRITGYTLRQSDAKFEVVRALRRLGCKVLAAGDSLNDLSMLGEADAAVLFRARASLQRRFPQYAATDSHETLYRLLCDLDSAGHSDDPPTQLT